MSRQELTDKYLNKFISRKLIVFIVATTGLFMKVIDGEQWVIISTAYMSIEGVTSIVQGIYRAKSGGSPTI